MRIEDWRIEELTGYQPITTFYTDFSIADKFGINAIKETYQSVFKEWQHDYKYMTELAMVLNWEYKEYGGIGFEDDYVMFVVREGEIIGCLSQKELDDVAEKWMEM